ncbi:MAG: hypothetical protein V7L14_29255 [Nostoc sp.]|uniref:hypothetical protein n=1 Tax=Nostoc sp. TaxID=1180 RepID=UPI002FFC4126
MVYSDFTLEKVAAVLGITTQEADLFPKLVPLSIPSWLNETLGKRTQLALIRSKMVKLFIYVTPYRNEAKSLH